MGTLTILKRVGRYFVPYWRGLALSLTCMLVVAASAGATAWLVKPVLDDIFINKDERMLVLLPVGVIVLYLVKGVARYVQSYVMRWMSESVIMRIREDIWYFDPEGYGVFREDHHRRSDGPHHE
ncbi:MAG: hypothetical protein SCH98_12295 [Deferrisomatales bacterium]|nr:hypothetical protein [Deferrisomatales bacterium]